MESFSLLDQASEDALHRTRLLRVEENPFKKITKRLFAPDRPSTAAKVNGAVDDDSGAVTGEDKENDAANSEEAVARLKRDVELDFALFESSIVRIQLLRTSNAQERVRYEEKKQQITETSQHVTESIASLRDELEAAKEKLTLRKEYDRRAALITNNRSLRPATDQLASIGKLKREIAELERESAEYGQTWKERKAQFDRIVHEGMELRKQIRHEKEEVERREGMAEHNDEEREGGDAKDNESVVAADSPMPDNDHPQPTEPDLLHASVLNRLKVPSAAATPVPSAPASTRDEGEVDDDVSMSDEGEIHSGDTSPREEKPEMDMT